MVWIGGAEGVSNSGVLSVGAWVEEAVVSGGSVRVSGASGASVLPSVSAVSLSGLSASVSEGTPSGDQEDAKPFSAHFLTTLAFTAIMSS